MLKPAALENNPSLVQTNLAVGRNECYRYCVLEFVCGGFGKMDSKLSFARFASRSWAKPTLTRKG